MKSNPKRELIKRLDALWKRKVIERWGSNCVVCGKPSGPPHHFVPKSLSLALRYSVKNGVPLCVSHHFAHHFKADPSITQAILRQRGRGWYDWIEQNRHRTAQKTLSWLREQERKLNRN
jgi:hypothetical protein